MDLIFLFFVLSPVPDSFFNIFKHFPVKMLDSAFRKTETSPGIKYILKEFKVSFDFLFVPVGKLLDADTPHQCTSSAISGDRRPFFSL
jgi:hypothetical protein